MEADDPATCTPAGQVRHGPNVKSMTAAATSPSAAPAGRGSMTFVRQVGRPEGAPDSSHFEFLTAPLPRPADGQVLVRNLYMSVDPYMREFMECGGWELGAGLEGRTLAQVIESREPSLPEGMIVL